MEFLFAGLSFVLGVAFALGVLDIYSDWMEREEWRERLLAAKKRREAEENDPVRKKVILDRYV